MPWEYLTDVTELLGRWLHVIAGIAWIGSSFYFVWLDNSLTPPKDKADSERGVFGELWSVHGGGFYHAQKYPLGPAQLPQELHWFKWESYATFLSGFFLLATLYYTHASTMLIDPAKMSLSPAAAIAISIGVLAGGWIVYDLLCRLFFKRSQLLFGVAYFFFVLLVAWGLLKVFPGRAAFLHIGAMIAATMSANVFFWIIPGQRKMVAARQAGQLPDPLDGILGKQRSVHNNYLTLPVLFCMISNHYAFTYGNQHALIVLGLILLGGVFIRHFFNLRHKGKVAWEYVAFGIVLLAAAFWVARPVSFPASAQSRPTPSFSQIQAIITARCQACHSSHPSLVNAAPAGLKLENKKTIIAFASRIAAMAGTTQVMPPGNITGITKKERQLLVDWAASKK